MKPKTARKQVTVIEVNAALSAGGALYDLKTLARMAAVQPQIVQSYCHRGFIPMVEPGPEGTGLFDDRALLLLKRITQMRRAHGLNLNGVALVLDLLRQIEELERELQFHRDRFL